MRTSSFSSFQYLVQSFKDHRHSEKAYGIGLNPEMQLKILNLFRGKIMKTEMTDTVLCTITI